MFMTNYELVYGKNTSSSDNNTHSHSLPAESEPQREHNISLDKAANAGKAVIGAHVTAAKFAGNAISKFSKKAVDYAKSDDAAEKAAFARDKIGSAFAGLKEKAERSISDYRESKQQENYDEYFPPA